MEEGFSVEVMDTTGAGDVYHGAFIAGLLRAGMPGGLLASPIPSLQ